MKNIHTTFDDKNHDGITKFSFKQLFCKHNFNKRIGYNKSIHTITNNNNKKEITYRIVRTYKCSKCNKTLRIVNYRNK